MREILITIKKELRSIFRDKKTFITLLLFPILIPAMIFLYAYMYEEESKDDLYSIGVNYSLNQNEISLMNNAHLKGKYYKSKKEMERAYSKGDILGYIEKKKNSNYYVVYTNEDSSDGMKVRSYVTAYLEGYNTYLAKVYLIGENVDVKKTFDQVQYKVVDLDGENFLLNLMFTIAFTYIVMSIVITTTNMATNATAVERENGTLETILTFPISSRCLILGKYLATVIMGFLSSLIGLILTIGSLEFVKRYFSFFEGLSYHVGLSSILISFVIIIMASLFIGGLSILLTSFTKSYKEAQSVSSILNILTIIPMMISLVGVSIQKWFYFIPIFNYTQCLMDIFSGKFHVIEIFMLIISSICYVAIILFYIVKQYRSEKVLFGK